MKQHFILHIGYGKTGTTSLQRNILMNHPNINYFGNPLFSKDQGLVTFEKDLLYSDSLFFEQKVDRMRGVLGERAGRYPQLIPFFSREQLLHSNRHREYGGHDIGRTLSRLADIFSGGELVSYPPCVMITIRRQPDIVRSYYGHISDRMGYQSFYPNDTFEDFLKREFAEPYRSYALSLRYYDVVQACCDLFGKEKVAVFPSEGLFAGRKREVELLAELLEDSPVRVLDLLSTCQNAPQNVRRSSTGVYTVRRPSVALSMATVVYRILIKLVGDRLLMAVGSQKTRQRIRRRLARNYDFAMSPSQHTYIKSVYENQNKKLDQLCNLGLKELEYYAS